MKTTKRRMFSAIAAILALMSLSLTGCSLLQLDKLPPPQTPVADDFDIDNRTQTFDNITAVTITPKPDKSTGKITIYYEKTDGEETDSEETDSEETDSEETDSTTNTKSTELPTEVGSYTVTFDVAAVTGWNEAQGLEAGTLTIIEASPVITDYNIGNLTQTFENKTDVSITPKSGKSTGDITIYYEGTGGTIYTKSTELPTTVGTYAVTFDVAATTGWNAASGFSAGRLRFVDYIAADINALGTWLSGQTDNTTKTPYIIALNYSYRDIRDIREKLNKFTNKFVSLDLSGSTIISIENGDLSSCPSLTSVIIPDSVTEIGSRAFRNCTNLTSVTFPDSAITISNGVIRIGNDAFIGCTGLTDITIPDSVISIGSSAFEGCTGLTGITIPNSVTKIESSAFEGCTKLASVTIGNGVTEIAAETFNNCTGLTSINIPNSVKNIGIRAFEGCTKLASVTIGNSVTKIETGAFSACTSLTGVTIPNSVTIIGDYAFSACTSLTSVTFAGTISSSYFGAGASVNPTFPGDLRDKFYATDSINGTPGTYTRPSGTSETWTKS